MTQIGFLANRSLPSTPIYFDLDHRNCVYIIILPPLKDLSNLQPAAQSLTRYSIPKKATRKISCRSQVSAYSSGGSR